MTLRLRLWALPVVLAWACEAGPSAFDRSVDTHPEDTADASELPELPDAPDVEAAGSLAEGDEADSTGAMAGTGRDATASIAVRDSTGRPAPVTLPPPPPLAAGEVPRFEKPAQVRGIYLNAWAAGSRSRVEALLALAARTEINTFVIDIKDATGYVSHPTAVPTSHEIGATEEVRIRDLPGLLARLYEAGIYPIARIVIVKDPLLSSTYPELAVQDTTGGVFVDGKNIVWLNPYDERVWEYHVQLAREVAGMGFPEIQWDYVRFPDIPASEKARTVYPGAGDMPKPDAIRSLLAYSREALADLDVTVTADVFGVTTSASRDVGIGQVWESFIDVVDVALPMVYPSHYWQGSFGFEAPNHFPYEIVKHALEDALRRSDAVEGAGVTRPWLQDFTLGPPRYEAPEVRAQIQATYDAGIEEWILWNPGARYTEAALEPIGGFLEEPMIRVAELIVPESRRFEVLDSIRFAETVADSLEAARADSLAGVRVDSAGVADSTAVADTLPVADSALAVDSMVSTPPDSLTRADTLRIR